MANVCDSFCDGCLFKGYSGELRMCRYLFETGKRRPCPPGEGCTVRQVHIPKPKRRKLTAEERKQRQLDRDRLYREKKRKSKENTVICDICGKAFVTSDTRKKHCSPACATRARTRATSKYKKRKAMEERNACQ